MKLNVIARSGATKQSQDTEIATASFAGLAMTVALAIALFFVFAPGLYAEAPVSSDAIAFSRLTNGYWQVWTVDANGDNLQQITTSLKDKRQPIWKPGEDKILFHTNSNELFWFDLASREEAPLLSELGQISEACFTPDGKKLIFTRFDENVKDSSNLWLYDFDTKEKILLTTDPGLQYSPYVSPDGKKVVYVAGKGWGTHEIWVLDLESKEKTRLMENETYDLSPEFSPNGAKIAYSSNLMGNYDVWIMDADGKNQHKITKPLGMESSPSWSPDGLRLVLASQKGGNLQIWAIDLEGRDWKQLTNGEEEAREPAWRR